MDTYVRMQLHFYMSTHIYVSFLIIIHTYCHVGCGNCISSVQVSQMFGMEESMEDLILKRRLRWLGHVARMDDSRLPKKMLFGWLLQRRPQHGTKMRWRDRVRKDMIMKKFGIDESGWFAKALDRGSWRSTCNKGLEACTKKRVESDLARRTIRSASHNTASQVAVADQYQ